jgi:hypothetical protein
MSWPPSPSSNFIVNGSTTSTTLNWGTDGVYGSAIVKSMRREDMAEEVLIENGTGLPAWVIQLVAGTEVEFTCIWDTATVTESNFNIGSVITLSNDPKTGQSNMRFLVTKNPLNLAAKQAAEFSVTGKYFSTAGVPSGN